MPRLQPSLEPHRQIGIILVEAKRAGWPWSVAWVNLLRSFEPHDGCPRVIEGALAEERELLKEIKPFIQARYEGREVTAAEFERTEQKAAQRLDAIAA